LFKDFYAKKLPVSFRIHPWSSHPNCIVFRLNITICCTAFTGVLFVGQDEIIPRNTPMKTANRRNVHCSHQLQLTSRPTKYPFVLKMHAKKVRQTRRIKH